MKNCKLLITAFCISCKHSGRWLLCLLCILLVCAGLLGAAFGVSSKVPDTQSHTVSIAIVNHDNHPMTMEILNSLSGMQQLSGVVELAFFDAREQAEGAICVVTIPEGFLASVLNGENLSPTVEYDASGVMESLWARQLAMAGARALSAAQRGVYAVQETVGYGAQLDEKTYSLLLASINMELMRTFLVRDDVIGSEEISALGALSLPEYYLTAALTAFFFSYGFLFYPAMDAMRRFARASRRSAPLFCAGSLHIFVLLLAGVTLVFSLLAGGLTLSVFVLSALYALLCALFASVACLLFASQAACAAGSILFTAGMSLCGGLLIPLGLMPVSFSAVAQLLPVYHAMKLSGAVLTGVMLTPSQLTHVFVICGVLLAATILLWRMRTEKGAA